MRRFILLIACAFSLPVLAADQAGCGTWANMIGAGSFSDPLSACRSTHPQVTGVDQYRDDAAVCLFNGGTMGQVYRKPACTNQCAEKSGEISTTNVTRGWARSSLANKADQLGTTSAVPKHICSGGCKFSVLGNEEAYRSQVPSDQGLYRLSSDVTVIQTDQSCDGETDMTSANPSTADMACPGEVGELNGKPYCAIGPGATGVDPNGLPGTGNSLDDKGNPKAGPKPKEGEGSGTGGVGRTPSEGSGGNMGGPGGAAAGGTGTKPGGKAPDGTTDKPKEGKEQEQCGAPGQKPCKIDETDVPREYDPKGKDKGIDEWKTKMDAQREEIKGSGDGTFGAIEILFSAPPFAGCDYIELPNNIGTLTRQCEVVGGVRDAMAYVWALAALWICIGWIREAV